MEQHIAMCELRDVKQRGYDAACCDFAINHNMEKLAGRVGIKSGTMLRNKLNPEQPHKLDPIDLALLCKESGDFTILNTLMADMGVITVPVPEGKDSLNLLERFLKNSVYAGDLSRDALAMGHTNSVPRSQKRKTLSKAQAALGNLVLLISDLESRTTGLQPLMQMGTDFLVNGSPIPGLA
ncbi:phage regulatory CII family protein [Vibrio sp. DW001]|uniref:phage regulatory CII family protein n=1 Tax=Vibrio sp. DW001 TaxID=2912315 RepID=UPI0023AF246F|nr:phage regulatory CII family protein [Vibrio sp. DW001]WED29025.1 phage regulatory CII family protein [Vibrio sp. DW001]